MPLKKGNYSKRVLENNLFYESIYKKILSASNKQHLRISTEKTKKKLIHGAKSCLNMRNLSLCYYRYKNRSTTQKINNVLLY